MQSFSSKKSDSGCICWCMKSFKVKIYPDNEHKKSISNVDSLEMNNKNYYDYVKEKVK